MKKNWYENKINECKNSSRLWRVIKKIVHGKGIKTQNNSNGVIFDSTRPRENQQIANKFNEYFVNSIYEIRNSINIGNDVELSCEATTQMNIEKFQEIADVPYHKIAMFPNHKTKN